MTSATLRIRALNDTLRRYHLGGRVLLTPGVLALGADVLIALDDALANYQAFTPDNDPYGEHDFGSVGVCGHVIFFKIDYYDRELAGGSPDPADPEVTCRVM